MRFQIWNNNMYKLTHKQSNITMEWTIFKRSTYVSFFVHLYFHEIFLHLLLYDSKNASLNFFKIRIRSQKICQPVVIVATFVENFTEWKWHMFDNGPWVGTKALNVDSAQWGLFYSIPFLEFLLWLPLIVFHSLKHFTKTKLTGWSKT